MKLLTTAIFASTALAIGQQSTINFNGNGMMLGSSDCAVTIMVDRSDYPAALRVANDLAIDFGRVTGMNGSVTLVGDGPEGNASMIFSVTGMTSFEMGGEIQDNCGGVIIAGTVGSSSLIDDIASSGRMDASAIEGRWEAYASALVESPVPGVDRAMVIAGSDRRGTVYGLYSVSEQIGVSPWYWFADSPVQKHHEVYATDCVVHQRSPSVDYRGFFINDEAPALTGYINAKQPPSPWGPGYNSDFYRHVFELLLRLRANYLWPAMWNSMFNVDDPRNQALAHEFGIVMGSSHTEPMARATKEWPTFGDGDWQWNTNNESIYPFFVEGAERAADFETLFTVGMRGNHDTEIEGGDAISQLESLTAAQFEILGEVFGEENVRDPLEVPQMWCLYKEVQGYYDDGMDVPDHVTLLWADDNFGNNRRLPVDDELDRSGGAGVYYHFDYVGDPRSYKWINTVNMQKTFEQMRLAHERQARRIWIVNVGDLKPMEEPISHFMDLAYDINSFDANSLPGWLEAWASREFGPDVAERTAEIMSNYSILTGRRNFELVDETTYSLINYNEGDRVLQEWRTMHEAAQAVMDGLPAETQPSFFQMVYHAVTAGYVFHDIMISSARNNLYAMQGRSSANTLAQHVLDQFEHDQELSHTYNTLLDGKWEHMMDQTHLGYDGYWQQPMRQRIPGLRYVATSERALTGDMGVSIDTSNATVPGDTQFHPNGQNFLTMPPFDPYGASSRWIDIYSVGINDFHWNITANASFVSFSQTEGTLSPSNSSDIRIWATFDFDQAPEGSGIVQVNISSNPLTMTAFSEGEIYGAQFNMPQLWLHYNNTQLPADFNNGFVESDSHISIEMSHYSSITDSPSDVHYEIIPGLSRTLSGITLLPATAPSQDSTGPALLYNLYTFSEMSLLPNNSIHITIATTASLNTYPDRPLSYAIQLDDQEIQTVQYIEDQPDGQNPVDWEAAVANNAWTTTSNFTYEGLGEHVLKVWALEPGLVFNTAWVDLGGIRESYLGPPESWRVE
ncbi:hypothetical protein MBLNU230_g3531t1 [Neophaeotheca triangularis]